MTLGKKTVEVHANQFDVIDDGFCISCSFGKIQGEAISYFQLQRQHEYDEQDRKLRQDKPYIELNDQKWGGYSCLERIEIKKNEIAFTVADACIERMRGAKIVRVILEAPVQTEVLNELKNYNAIWGIPLSIQEV